MSRQVHSRQRAGFTLVELLVVIGIIALLVAILLPSLNRARESAQRVACLSNMRQLGLSMVMYTTDNKGKFPFAGVENNPADWAYWEPNRDKNQSPLVKYQGGRFNEKLYQCPSDIMQSHRKLGNGGIYPFSYTINWNIGYYSGRMGNVKPPPVGQYPPVIGRVQNSSKKIMFIDESWETVDDGCWAPERWFVDQQNMLAIRHDKRAEVARESGGNVNKTLLAGRGNVIFVDGHADFIARKDALDPAYYDPFQP